MTEREPLLTKESFGVRIGKDIWINLADDGTTGTQNYIQKRGCLMTKLEFIQRYIQNQTEEIKTQFSNDLDAFGEESFRVGIAEGLRLATEGGYDFEKERFKNTAIRA